MVSGLDYDPQRRWRRVAPDTAIVTTTAFTQGLARRVEAQIRNDWSLVPAARSVWFKWTAEHTHTLYVDLFWRQARPVARDFGDGARAGSEYTVS